MRVKKCKCYGMERNGFGKKKLFQLDKYDFNLYKSNGHFSWKKKAYIRHILRETNPSRQNFIIGSLTPKINHRSGMAEQHKLDVSFQCRQRKENFFVFWSSITHTIATTQQHMPEQSSSRALGRTTAWIELGCFLRTILDCVFEDFEEFCDMYIPLCGFSVFLSKGFFLKDTLVLSFSGFKKLVHGRIFVLCDWSDETSTSDF